MKKIPSKNIFLTAIISLLLITGLITFSRTTNAQDNSFVQGQVLVQFKDSTPQTTIDAAIKQQGAKQIAEIKKIHVLVLKTPPSQEQKVITALSHNPHVSYAELDYIAQASSNPNDPYFANNQWGLENTGQTIKNQTGTTDADIDITTAWNTTSGSANTKIAVLDTGIDQNHEDISSKIVSNINFTDSPTIDDIYGHGTHVAGIIAASTNNSTGVAGGCPQCSLMNVKSLNDSGSGAYSWIANGIIFATDNGAKVINMSLGGSTKSITLEQAVNYAWDHNVVVIAAAGNSGTSQKNYPAAYQNVIAVAATDNRDIKASFSNYGTWVSVAAPGANIFSTLPNHDSALSTNYGYSKNYDFLSGTSMATPMTSAVAGLLWSTPYNTSASSIRNRLESTADHIAGTGIYWTSGRINAGAAVEPNAISTPTPTQIAPTPTTNTGFSLITNGYKVKGVQNVNLTWSGAQSTNIDLYRNGSIITTITNNGTYTDNLNQKGTASYNYFLCEQGTTTCSNTSLVNF